MNRATRYTSPSNTDRENYNEIRSLVIESKATQDLERFELMRAARLRAVQIRATAQQWSR